VDPADPPAITKEILFGVINVLVRDQPGPIRAIVSDEACAGFNPQPDPPGVGLVHDPWRAVAVSRAIISQAALSMSANANDEEGMRASRMMLGAFLDDFCDTGPQRRIPLPAPWPRFDLRPNALDVVIAAAQFHAASVALKDHPLSNDLANGADRLLEAALERLTP
jgi:hypothetical protein